MIKTSIIDGKGEGREAHVHTREENSGLITYTDSLFTYNAQFQPFLNDTFGTAMNQNVSFGGTPEVILDGAGGGWATQAIQGTWNFTDAGKVTITLANDNDEAKFDDAGTIDMSDYTALTGKVDLDVYNELNNSILVQFGLAEANVGNSVNLNDHIDTGDFAEQSFSITKDDFGIDGLTIDEMTITITRSGGSRPTIKFDDWQIEETGSPLVYKSEPRGEDIYYVNAIRMLLTDAVTGITTVAGATENATLQNTDYATFLGVAALTNGITFTRIQADQETFSAQFRSLGDMLFGGFKIIDFISNGTTAALVLEVGFSDPIRIVGGGADYLTFTISDNLSGLTGFRATARGAVEKTL